MLGAPTSAVPPGPHPSVWVNMSHRCSGDRQTDRQTELAGTGSGGCGLGRGVGRARILHQPHTNTMTSGWAAVRGAGLGGGGDAVGLGGSGGAPGGGAVWPLCWVVSGLQTRQGPSNSHQELLRCYQQSTQHRRPGVSWGGGHWDLGGGSTGSLGKWSQPPRPPHGLLCTASVHWKGG